MDEGLWDCIPDWRASHLLSGAHSPQNNRTFTCRRSLATARRLSACREVSKVLLKLRNPYNYLNRFCSAPLAVTVCTVIYFPLWFDYRVVPFLSPN